MLDSPGAATVDVADVTEAVLSDADYQRALPAKEAPQQAPPPDWLQDLMEWLLGAGDFANAALWVLGAGLVIWVAVRLFQLRGPGSSRPGTETVPSPAGARRHVATVDRHSGPPVTLVDADALAAERRFGEAIHALLLHCVGEIKKRPGFAISDSLTGREIARRTVFSDDTRAAFRNLVARAEKSHFGNHPAREDDYRTCRQDYLRITAAIAPA